jgi:uncharacterized membrane protein
MAFACLLFMHVAILSGAYAAAVAVGLAYACINLGIACSMDGRRSLTGPWLVPVILMSGVLISVWYGYASAVALVLVPSVLVNALLFVLFGHTLLPKREPLITRFRRAEMGFVTPVFSSYTRHLTLLWTLLFAIATASSLAAAVWGDLTLWSWISFIGVPVTGVTLFFGEHIYRAFRFGHEGRASPLRTLRTVLHPGAWRGVPMSRPDMHGSIHE